MTWEHIQLLQNYNSLNQYNQGRKWNALQSPSNQRWTEKCPCNAVTVETGGTKGYIFVKGENEIYALFIYLARCHFVL